MKQSDLDAIAADLQEAFPRLDIGKEIERARLWLKLDGKKIKNPGTFLFKWMANAEEKLSPEVPVVDVGEETSTRKKIGGVWHHYVTPGGWWQPQPVFSEEERKAILEGKYEASEQEVLLAEKYAEELLRGRKVGP